jgi:F-type H+-transporting ATPase subunit epsilon
MELKLDCSILTPDKQLYEGQVHFAVVQAFDGEIGFLFNHAPFVSELGIGEVRLRTADQTEYFVVEGGFVEIKENELVLLAESAFKKHELVKDSIEKRMAEISEGWEARPYAERMVLEVELKKLKARLKVVSR